MKCVGHSWQPVLLTVLFLIHLSPNLLLQKKLCFFFFVVVLITLGKRQGEWVQWSCKKNKSYELELIKQMTHAIKEDGGDQVSALELFLEAEGRTKGLSWF